MRSTRSQELFRKLADQIVAGDIAPGQRLDELAIARQFAVSRTPVREALRQLSGAGLVEARSVGGFAAARIDGAQLAEMFETLGELEGLCAKWSALRMSEIERQKLNILTSEFAKAVESSDYARFAVLNEQFHQTVYAGTHNTSLQQVTQGFRQRLAPFRVPGLFLIEGRLDSSLAEHREILDAITKGDGERASHAIRTHVASASVSVIDHFERVRAGIVPKYGTTRRSESDHQMSYEMKGKER
jgi:DNA-binding GntR family transcriptional regulator